MSTPSYIYSLHKQKVTNETKDATTEHLLGHQAELPIVT